jgi:hypothetical protein
MTLRRFQGLVQLIIIYAVRSFRPAAYLPMSIWGYFPVFRIMAGLANYVGLDYGFGIV